MTTGVWMVTGTDTGVGKTAVSRGLLRSAFRRGLRLTPLKPFETGCIADPSGKLHAVDAEALARAAGLSTAEDVCQWAFAPPAAPLVAARAAKTPLNWSEIVQTLLGVVSRSRPVLLEGAGGLLVPITVERSFADLATALDARVIVVARDALGTLNHTLLTIDALVQRGIHVDAVVLNAVDPSDRSRDTPTAHREQLQELRPWITVYGPMPWRPGASDDALADAVESIGLAPLITRMGGRY